MTLNLLKKLNLKLKLNQFSDYYEFRCAIFNKNIYWNWKWDHKKKINKTAP